MKHLWLILFVMPLFAQEVVSGLTLVKNGEEVLIPLDEWVAVSTANDNGNILHGNYLGMTVDCLLYTSDAADE